jgi:hypothetical protein
MMPPLTFCGDCLIDDFEAEDVKKVSNNLDFWFERQILSSDKYMRKMELHSIIRVDWIQDIPHQPWVVPNAIDRLKTIFSTTGDTHADHVPIDVQSWDSVMSNELIHRLKEYLWFSKFDTSQPESFESKVSESTPITAVLHPRASGSCLLYSALPSATRINLMECMCSSFVPDLLSRHIFENLEVTG